MLFFFWLLLKDRLNTRELLLRKRFPLQSAACVLCSVGASESLKHLFFECSFSQLCWSLVGLEWDLSLSVPDLMLHGKQRSRCKLFKEIVILTCWSIWLHRNKVIFKQSLISIQQWKYEFKEAFALVIHRVKPSLKGDFVCWLRDFG